MKIAKFLAPAFFVIAFTSGCNNQTSQHTGESDTKHDSAMAHTNDGHHSTGMAKAMENMMDDMHQINMTGNIDVDFALMMKSHHQGALDMAEVEVNTGTDEIIKSMAQKMIEEQKAEISALDKFLDNNRSAKKNYDPADKENGFGKVMDKSMKMSMEMPEAGKGSVDQDFISMMIPHHQSAVYMSEGFLQSGKDPTLRSMAKKMISDQNREIDEMKSMLSR